ncbi:hypothetical protein Glove_137g42 [Diversispora epigaea]|uniref:Uncharacterized protein n=1 Tax=Diversispora epigaea TaxID=1348612 RepID=A0A397J5H9_9GLOM|nr:hypothetical protein Glove_137g42 [Diversispora epigaea]
MTIEKVSYDIFHYRGPVLIIASRRPSDTSSLASSITGTGEFDEAIRNLRSGLKKTRMRPVSRVFIDLQSSGHIRGPSSSSHHRRTSSSIQHIRYSSTFLHTSSSLTE